MPTKVHIVKPIVFPVVMYGCESWTMKKAENQRIDVFQLWCLRRLLRVPWTIRISNHSILKEINPEYSLEGLTLKLKLQYSGHLMQRTDSLEKALMLGKIEVRRRRGWQRIRWLDGVIDSMDMSLSKLCEMVKDREDWCVAVSEIQWLNSILFLRKPVKDVLHTLKKDDDVGLIVHHPLGWKPCDRPRKNPRGEGKYYTSIYSVHIYVH